MTEQPPLYTASVPVFRRYIGQMSHWVEWATADDLDQRIADTFPARQQFATATGFTLRIACPLAGVAIPELPVDLSLRMKAACDVLDSLAPAAFIGAERRTIRHKAGFSELTQDGETFLHQFGMPNFLFHVTMGYAALRMAGVAIGKADFDGFHSYPDGFRF